MNETKTQRPVQTLAMAAMLMAVGFVLPLLRSATLGMPPMFPTGIAMAFELAAYGSWRASSMPGPAGSA